jgi:hypothetical protein
MYHKIITILNVNILISGSFINYIIFDSVIKYF